jgi:hypothetical protein
MNRRQFLITSSAAAVGTAAYRTSLGQVVEATTQQSVDVQQAELTVDLQSTTHLVPLNYNGVSYELSQLSKSNFFAATNTNLIAMFRLLSPQGVLRLGGNTSESCWFKPDASTTAPDLRPPDGSAAENWMPKHLFMIEPEAIDHLADFLNATGWQLIYGFNLGNSSPERAAREAEYVAKKIGDRLLYFQIGNEPDFYHNASNGTRPANWGFTDYLDQWTQFADAISARVPQAKFGGPDVGASSDWIFRFINGAAQKLGTRLAAVTGHYYAEGPPDDPKVTTERLLRTDPEIFKRTEAIVNAAAKHHLVYRMTEGNSCYRGGKPGMSDALASALWAGDYMLTLAMAGCAGVNLHGGSREFLRASLGDHMPGEQLAKNGAEQNDPSATPDARIAKGGYYTPIAGEVDVGFTARPIFYGMYLANQFAGANTHSVALKNIGAANATAYAAEKNSQLLLAVFNKGDAHDFRLALRTPAEYKQAKVWRLKASALDSTSGVTLAGAEMSTAGTWSPSKTESLQVTTDGTILEMPHASAALVFLDR